MKLESKYEVQAAHRLTAGVPEGHPCRRLHGHRYNIAVTIAGPINSETGMVLEYAEIDRLVHQVLGFIDHRFINRLGYAGRDGELDTWLAGFTDSPEAELVRKNSTVEHLAVWIDRELARQFALLESGLGVVELSVEEDSGHRVRL